MSKTSDWVGCWKGQENETRVRGGRQCTSYNETGPRQEYDSAQGVSKRAHLTACRRLALPRTSHGQLPRLITHRAKRQVAAPLRPPGRSPDLSWAAFLRRAAHRTRWGFTAKEKASRRTAPRGESTTLQTLYSNLSGHGWARRLERLEDPWQCVVMDAGTASLFFKMMQPAERDKGAWPEQ